MAKCLGPITDYLSDPILLQFVYDLWLWSSLGAKKNGVDAPLRIALAGYSFSPEYWRRRHAALIDMVKQLGLPTLFITIAPYEWSWPFHEWVEDSLRKQLRSRLHLPAAEVLHMAHVLTQVVVGFLTGANKQDESGINGKPWRSHVFGATDGSGKQTVMNYFGRIEFQDGKRKRYVNMQEIANQYYHGRGTPHVHLLIWLEDVEAVGLQDKLAATSPAENEQMQELVEKSQRSYTGSAWPENEGPSNYDAEAGRLALYHSSADYCTYNAAGVPEGIRAYIKDVLASLCCHMDVQMADRVGMLLQYVSGYVPKFSDAFCGEWLNDACSDYCIARRILTDYHPTEAEMVLQLLSLIHI